jgi:hypothetical protein
MQERNDWVKRLKEQVTSVRQKASSITPAEQDTDIIFDDTIASGTDRAPDALTSPQTSPAPQEPVMTHPQKDTGGGEASATGPPSKIPLSSRFHPASSTPGKPNFSAIAAIIIVILAVVGGVFIYSNNLQGPPPEPSAPVTAPITTAATTAATPLTTTIVPEQTLTLPATPPGTLLPVTQPPVIIPETGVWVRVQYAGGFTGQVGISGGMRQVSGSGERFYQIPTVGGVVEAMIQKQDGSGDVLAVEIYKNGTLAKRTTVAAPRGSVDIHVDLKTV